MAEQGPLSEVEGIKAGSRGLRGTIRESLADPLTGALRPADQQLIKFHGSYQQHDRSLEQERRRQKLEPLYSFMLRVRVPAGVTTPAQWLALDELAEAHGSGTLKVTTRQAVELHGVLKRDLRCTIGAINASMLDTLAACGDVNRNVMASAVPWQSGVHAQVEAAAKAIQAHLSPRTRAYHELWVNDELAGGGAPEDPEPIYGKTYLPRKFKIAIAVPPVNDTDVYADDIGLVAVVVQGKVEGYNVAVGGGMSMTFGMPETFPRLATAIGFVPHDRVVEVCEKILLVQKDNGDRSNRKTARLKYTVERMTVAGFRAEVERRLGYALEPERPVSFATNGDSYGWHKGDDGRWHKVLFIEGGRVRDEADYPLRTGLREIARVHRGTFILTGNQNVIVAGISAADKPLIDALLDKYRITAHQRVSGARGHSLACVALPLCSLAFAEAERALPSLMDRIDAVLGEAGLREEPVTVRMTGCPNGCARPFLGEVALVGRAEGVYNLYLGGSHTGDRLNVLYKEMLKEPDILAALKEVFGRYARERQRGERFGDFVRRAGIVG